ncbi:MAG: HAMP domain-containing sensor histidine kinase [Gemmatimonadota bacterium]|nr:HAMP domain-containing sensor histidine kinase [Gemmatimonadota bacterium]
MTIRWRLALWYGALAAAVVAAVCGYSYYVFRSSQEEELDAMLASTVEHVADELASAGGDAQRQRVLDASLQLGAATRLYDQQGALLAASASVPGIPRVAPLAVLRANATPAAPDDHLRTDVHNPRSVHGAFVTLGDSARWRAFVAPLDSPPGYLATLLPRSRVDKAVATFGWYMIAMLVAGASAAVVMGWLIAGRALRPIAGLSQAATEIARTRAFGRRLPPGSERDELGRLSTTFNLMLGSLESAYNAQASFVADASHELRAPLTAIQGSIDIARDPRLGDAGVRDRALGDASGEASRMARLLADLLALARADAGMALASNPVELDRVVMDVLGEARHLIHGQHLVLGNVTPSTVWGDRERLRQLALILVDNAIRYTPSGGRITVSVGQRDDAIVLTVSDSGIGIATADLPRIFDRFFRAQLARAHDPGGTGLGLAIGRWIADLHGATIAVESRPGEGTTFAVSFARRPAPAPI